MCLVDGEVYGWNETLKRPTLLSSTFLAPIGDQFDFSNLASKANDERDENSQEIASIIRDQITNCQRI